MGTTNRHNKDLLSQTDSLWEEEIKAITASMEETK